MLTKHSPGFIYQDRCLVPPSADLINFPPQLWNLQAQYHALWFVKTFSANELFIKENGYYDFWCVCFLAKKTVGSGFTINVPKSRNFFPVRMDTFLVMNTCPEKCVQNEHTHEHKWTDVWLLTIHCLKYSGKTAPPPSHSIYITIYKGPHLDLPRDMGGGLQSIVNGNYTIIALMKFSDIVPRVGSKHYGNSVVSLKTILLHMPCFGFLWKVEGRSHLLWLVCSSSLKPWVVWAWVIVSSQPTLLLNLDTSDRTACDNGWMSILCFSISCYIHVKLKM